MPQQANPGSALGEAIGAQMESALNRLMQEIADSAGYHFVCTGPNNPVTGRTKKLLMFDRFGTAYNIDSVIANAAMQPVILFESKYIRYTKHNRDKGSWLCTAHPALRRRYNSIRSSIAILSGNWSSSSVAMLKSHDINVFMVPFDCICDLLSEHGIAFNWDEKDRDAAVVAWRLYQNLNPEEKAAIGTSMVDAVRAPLSHMVCAILDDATPREIDRVTLELHTNLGELHWLEFASVTEAVDFLNTYELQDMFITTDSPKLFDPTPDILD
jgi:hypothetical protein